MRILSFVVAAAVLAGCATVPQQEDEESSAASMTGKADESVAWGPCAASRATILASVSAQRAAAISRGFTWLDADVPFSMTATHQSYRTDCSGFVSMCWSLGAPGANTRSLGTAGSGSYKLGSYDDLVPADALVDVGKHAVIFLGWNDSAHKGACVLEQSSTKNDMQFRVRMKSQLQVDGFVPMRSDDFANDTTVKTPSAAETSSGTTTGTEKAPADPSTDDKYGTSGGTSGGGGSNQTPVCKSTSVAVVCAAASVTGIECGRVIDNCGRPVDCTGMPGYGCETGETCNSNKCTSTCVPKSKADLCYSAELKSGVQCGSIPDGCGGTVDCSELPDFQCASGTCGDDNKCPGATPSTPTNGGASPHTDVEHCEGSHDDPEVCPPSRTQGDPGDEGDAHTSSTRTTSSDDEDSDDEPRRKGVALGSGGCSSAPGSTSGLGTVALAFFVMMGARRRRAGSKSE